MLWAQDVPRQIRSQQQGTQKAERKFNPPNVPKKALSPIDEIQITSNQRLSFWATLRNAPAGGAFALCGVQVIADKAPPGTVHSLESPNSTARA